MSSRARASDPVARELAQHLHALPASRYEFAVFDGRTVRRVVGARRALAAVGWLKHRNGRGGHVYVRPATTACVLVENVTAETLARAHGDGLAPAAVVEAAPGRLEAWFRLGSEGGRELGLCVAQILAARYGAGPRDADVRRLGRAAGFANRTAGLAEDGRYPRVRVLEARGRVTTRADELVAEAAAQLVDKASRRAVRAAGKGAVGPASSRRHGPQRALAREMARLARRYGTATDRGRAEAAAARCMALAGWSRTDVAAAVARRRERAPPGEGGVDGKDVARIVARAFGDVRR